MKHIHKPKVLSPLRFFRDEKSELVPFDSEDVIDMVHLTEIIIRDNNTLLLKKIKIIV